MGTKITAVDVHDVRFPTAATADGSDAINRGDYSATYVELRTDAGPTGAGLTFTNGPWQRDHVCSLYGRSPITWSAGP